MYDTLVLIDPENQLTLKDAETALRTTSFSVPATIQVDGNCLTVDLGDYQLKVWRASEEHVLEESEEMASQDAQNHPARDRIALCHTRFEVSGDDDLHMDYFNDYVFVIEALEGLGKVYTYTQADGSFADQ